MKYEIVRKIIRKKYRPSEDNFNSEDITKLINDKNVISMEHSIIPEYTSYGSIDNHIETFVFLIQTN